jgi:hypothetical protein
MGIIYNIYIYIVYIHTLYTYVKYMCYVNMYILHMSYITVQEYIIPYPIVPLDTISA